MRALALLCLASLATSAELSVALHAAASPRAATATLADVATLTGDEALVAACSAVVVQELPDLAAYRIDGPKVRAALGGVVRGASLSVDGVCALSRAPRSMRSWISAG